MSLFAAVVVGALAATFMAYGIGANDVANAFATSVGSKALKLWQAVILAGIFEVRAPCHVAVPPPIMSLLVGATLSALAFILAGMFEVRPPCHIALSPPIMSLLMGARPSVVRFAGALGSSQTSSSFDSVSVQCAPHVHTLHEQSGHASPLSPLAMSHFTPPIMRSVCRRLGRITLHVLTLLVTEHHSMCAQVEQADFSD